MNALLKHPCQDCHPPQRHPGCRNTCPVGPVAEAFEEDRRRHRDQIREEKRHGREADDFWADQVARTKRDIGM